MDEVSFIKELYLKLADRVHDVIEGMDKAIQALLIALLSGGHILLEGPPGIAKTYLAKAFSSALGLEFKRIQFTSDILPSDIIGSMIYDKTAGSFIFRKGPIFGNVILADEINRAPPRSQSALLELMQERQVTVEGVRYELPKPFMIIATQNPIELEGTYPLPEAEVDRFMMRILLDYPDRDEEVRILSKKTTLGEWVDVEPITSAQDILKAIQIASGIFVDEAVLSYIADLARATRRHPKVALGVSPRGAVMLLYASKAKAAIEGKPYVTPDHVKSVTSLVFNHRIILKGGGSIYSSQRREVFEVLRDIFEEVSPPR